jgi:aspartate kinase
MVHGFLRSVFEAMDRYSASVDIVAISEVSLSFTMETKRLPQALLDDLEKIADVTCENEQAIICLVGEDIHGKPGIAASVFNTIAEAKVNIRMISQGASEINISFVVKQSDVPQAVRHLHAHFFPDGAAKAKVVSQRRNGIALRVRTNGVSPNGKRKLSANRRGGVRVRPTLSVEAID